MKGESMQNKTLILLGALVLSTTSLVSPARAQEAAPAIQPSEVSQAAQEQVVVPTEEKTKVVDEMLGENVNINPDKIVDFPVRPSLGSLEMATLPGINETLITGPAPVGESLSSKDMPSEQLLGRITTEVFQEMADLERGNVFLKLQSQKEELKNNLESLRAKYRQARLDEIAKREEVVRSRIDWWQKQENIRIEMEKKKAETEAIEQQIAEAEELRNKLRSEAMAEKEAAKNMPAPVEQASPVKEEAKVAVVEPEPAPTPEPEFSGSVGQSATSLYSLLGVRGLKGRLTARLENKEDGSVLNVKKGQRLKTGHKILRVDRDSVQVSFAGRVEVILLASPKTIVDSSSESSEEEVIETDGE